MGTPTARLERPWFESPFFEREIAESELAPDERELVERFAREGWVTLDLSGPELDRIAGEISAALDGRLAERGFGIQDAWREVAAVRELAAHPKVAGALRAIYQRRPIPFQTLNFLVGSEHAPHSDEVHFDTMPPRFMCGVWTALEDVGPGSGELVFYPRSHRLPVFAPFDLGLSASAPREQTYPAYERFLAELVERAGLERRTFAARKGEALVWASNLIHGGGPITAPGSTRRSQVTHYFFEGCRYWTPLRSEPALGRYFWRRVINVETGEVEPHRYRGRIVRPPLRSRLRAEIAWRATGPGPLGRAAERLRKLASRGG